MLAIGDGLGTLHILEIPRSLAHPSPNEEAGVAAYFAREVERSAFGKGRWETRAREKRDREKAEALAQVRDGSFFAIAVVVVVVVVLHELGFCDVMLS